MLRFREAMLSGAGHCRANIIIFLQEICYAQRGCEASCVRRKQEICYLSGAGQCWVNIVYLRTRWQVLGWIFSSPAGMSNCLQENRRARAGTNFFQELLSFCVWVGRNFPQMSSDISCYCTSPRSRQYTYPLPLGIKILYTKNIVKTVRFTVALHGGGMVASEGSLERVYSPWTKVWKAPENDVMHM